MALTRRQFLQRSAASALVLGAPSFLLQAFGARSAHAAGLDPILVMIQLEGGNDGLNTVIPTDDVGGPQRTRYQSLRPTLGIPLGALASTPLGADPATGTGLALHPAMTGLWQLYQQGRVAVVNGVGVPSPTLSHFEMETAWFSGDPSRTPGPAWLGRWLDANAPQGVSRALSLDRSASPLFVSEQSAVLGMESVRAFSLPRAGSQGELAARRLAWLASYAAAGLEPGLIGQVGAIGNTMLSSLELFEEIETKDWGSALEGIDSNPARRLLNVVSILRHDALDPARDTGARLFHFRISGFDTHTDQGSTNASARHPRLLRELSEAVKAFHDDVAALGLADRVLIMTFSEFGRRAAENGTGSGAGTDHGVSAPLFLIGNAVQGGLYGRVPDLSDLDAQGNTRSHVDFRQVYATVIDRWLGGDHAAILPGAPFTPLGALPAA